MTGPQRRFVAGDRAYIGQHPVKVVAQVLRRRPAYRVTAVKHGHVESWVVDGPWLTEQPTRNLPRFLQLPDEFPTPNKRKVCHAQPDPRPDPRPDPADNLDDRKAGLDV